MVIDYTLTVSDRTYDMKEYVLGMFHISLRSFELVLIAC